jgi:hypothetical protein
MNTAGLAQQRCLNHARREAVARCPECAQFFCRECVTEHEDRVICAGCLKKLVRGGESVKRRLAVLLRAFQCGLSLLLLWGCFYGMGRILLSIPSEFHDGSVWRMNVWEAPE